MDRDTVSFRLGVRGDAQNLRRAIGLGRKLVPVTEDSAAPAAANPRLHLRYSD